jgi:hypothetical protein
MFVIAATSGRLALGLALPVLCVTAPPSITLRDTLARLVASRRPHRHRVTGKYTDNVVAARHEQALADLAFKAYTTVLTACREMNGSSGSNRGAVWVQFGCFPTLCNFSTPLWVKLSVSELLTSR